MIAGLDVSLTGSGVCLCWPVSGAAEPVVIRSTGKKGASLGDRARRLRRLAGEILQAVDLADVVIVESPAYGSITGSQHDRSGLWWSVIQALSVAGVLVYEVTPAAVKTYAAGKGNAGKIEVVAAMVRRFPELEIVDDNAADALALATLGGHALRGRPVVPVPAKCSRALDGLPWAVTRIEA